nr:unnamed protein product [Digitaria exilis]
MDLEVRLMMFCYSDTPIFWINFVMWDFRRRNVTDEWRNSVLPILWRCQWLELRMKELSSQVSKYDRELALIKKEKEIQQPVSKANGSMSESMHSHKCHGSSIMKRRKRKRHEENADASLYICEHQILSYFHGKQNQGGTGGLLIDDDRGSTVDFMPVFSQNTDDILIDNACQQLDNAKHLPSGTSSKGQNISGPAETKSTCAPVEAKNSCAPVVEPVSPQRKQEPKPKKMMKKRSFSTKKQRKEDSKTHATKKITEDVAAAAKNKTRSTLSAAAAEKTERKPSGAPGPGTMTACSAGKKHKTGNEPPDKKCESLASKKQETVKLSSAAKKQETVKLSSAAKKLETVKLSSAAKKQETMKLSSSANRQKTEKPSSTGKKQETMKLSSSANRQKTENPSSAGKKQKTENPSSAAKQQETENMPSSTKETESSPLNLKIEKSVVVAVNSRRSQRVRKPKVFAE